MPGTGKMSNYCIVIDTELVGEAGFLGQDACKDHRTTQSSVVTAKKKKKTNAELVVCSGGSAH